MKKNEDAVFQCFALSYGGGLKYDWKPKDGSSLPPNAKISLDYFEGSSTLAIPKAKQSYNKQYCCMASNKAGTAVQCASLVVY